jgi:signal transduction histidine kinase
MLTVKTYYEKIILMKAWRRNLSSVFAALMIIIGTLPIFLKQAIDYYYIPIFKIVILTVAIAILVFYVFRKEKMKTKNLIALGITLFLFFMTELHNFVIILYKDLNLIFIPNFNLYQTLIYLHYLLAMIPLYVLMISQIRKTEKYAPRRLKLASLFITVVIIIFMSPIIVSFITKTSAAGDYASIVYSAVTMIINLDIFATSLAFIYLLRKVRTPFFWITIAVAWFFKITGDAAKGYFWANNMYEVGTMPDLLYNMFYALFVIGIFTILERYEKPLTIFEMDRERKQYQTLYEEMNIFARDLVTVTSLLRHDLLNDLVVIQSGVELYEETNKHEYLERALGRVDVVADRLEILKSETKLLESLKIQSIDIDIIDNVVESFDNITILPYPSDIKVSANRLLYPILFNIIQNAFQHAGKKIEAEVKIEELEEEVLIRISDNGVGISEENKKQIFDQEYRGTDKGISGMGLFLAKIVIESYGGSIQVLDNEPHGTVFEIKLNKFKEEKQG